MKEYKLTPKQEAFIQEYMKNGGNQSAAYRHAYNAENMKEQVINNKASLLFAKGYIKVRLDFLQKELAKENKMSKEWVLEQLKNIISKSSQNEMVIDKNGGNSGEYKYDSAGVNKALDTVSKMMGYYATEKKEVTLLGEIELTQLPTKNKNN